MYPATIYALLYAEIFNQSNNNGGLSAESESFPATF